jgi:simple sugar transport system permease protein
MHAGAGLMQAQAEVPVQLVGVLQAVILFFLAAELVVRRLLRVRTAGTGVGTELETISRSYGEQASR